MGVGEKLDFVCVVVGWDSVGAIVLQRLVVVFVAGGGVVFVGSVAVVFSAYVCVGVGGYSFIWRGSCVVGGKWCAIVVGRVVDAAVGVDVVSLCWVSTGHMQSIFSPLVCHLFLVLKSGAYL